MCPIDGVNAPEGPTAAETIWAETLNTSFVAMDGHNHSDNSGESIDVSAINFNNDFNCDKLFDWVYFAFFGDKLDDAHTVTSDGVDLVVYDGIGREIYVTREGVLNSPATVGGGFIGDYVSSGAQVVFSSVTNTYDFGLNTLIGSILSCQEYTFSQVTTCKNFSVIVPVTQSILFTMPASAAGMAYLDNASSFLTLPYLACSATNTIPTQAALTTGFFSLMTNASVRCMVSFNAGFLYTFYFTQENTTQSRGGFQVIFTPARPRLAPSIPLSRVIPFIECATMQSVPIVSYTTTGASVDYTPFNEVIINSLSSNIAYGGRIAVQSVWFPTDDAGVPVAGGLGG